MRPDPGFTAMRARLVRQGLLSADHRLTDAGNAHVAQLIEALREAECDDAPKPAVRWNTGQRFWKQAA